MYKLNLSQTDEGAAVICWCTAAGRARLRSQHCLLDDKQTWMQSKRNKSSRPECRVNTLISLKARSETNQCYGKEEEGQQREQNPLKRRKMSCCQSA